MNYNYDELGHNCRYLTASYCKHEYPCPMAGKVTEISTGRVLSPVEAQLVEEEMHV